MSDFSWTLDALEPYILGKEFTGEVKERVRLDKHVLEDFLTMLDEDNIAKDFFNAYENANDFYETMIDFKHYIPKEQRQEVFYAAKMDGEYYSEIPSFCAYIVKKSYEVCNGIPNLLLKVIPTACLKEFFKEGYFSPGLTFRDVICNLCNENYNPISIKHPKNKIGNFTEFYIATTDMVAALPNSIADELPNECCETIKQTPVGLEVGGVLIRVMANHVGAINSTYDLRELL